MRDGGTVPCIGKPQCYQGRVTSFVPWPLHPWERTSVPSEEEAGWSPEHLLGFKLKTIQPIASRYADSGILRPTETIAGCKLTLRTVCEWGLKQATLFSWSFALKTLSGLAHWYQCSIITCFNWCWRLHTPSKRWYLPHFPDCKKHCFLEILHKILLWLKFWWYINMTTCCMPAHQDPKGHSGASSFCLINCYIYLFY